MKDQISTLDNCYGNLGAGSVAYCISIIIASSLAFLPFKAFSSSSHPMVKGIFPVKGNIINWLKMQTLDPDCLGANPSCAA